MASAYDDAWRELERRERRCFLVALFFVPCAVVVMLIWSGIARDVPVHFGLWIGGIWLTAFVVAHLHRLRFLCPRCGDLFFARAVGRGELDARCSHCRLPRGLAARG